MSRRASIPASSTCRCGASPAPSATRLWSPPCAASAPIAVTLVQWGGPLSQAVAVDWATVFDAASAARFAERIAASRRLYLVERTAIAHVLDFAMGLIDGNDFDGRRQVIDVSGDGPNNYGYHPDRMRDWAVAAGITVNGLAILGEHPDVAGYYRDHVIGGPGAFLVLAADYRDFARAIRLKLRREIEGAPLAFAAPSQVSSPRAR